VVTKTQGSRVEGTAGDLPARERLLAAAEELFYEEGVHSVGINRVLARAGVAKDTLYSAFGSKEALIRAYLARRRESTVARLSGAIAKQDDPRQKILAVFDSQATVFREPGFKGCAFVAASSEAPPGGVIETDATEYRTWRRNLFTDLARQAGAADPDQLGQQLNVLYDGAELTARMDHNPDIAAVTRNAVAVLLEATIPNQEALGHPADEPATRKQTAKKQSRG
jgi:AcrR family transcriptional regulator